MPKNVVWLFSKKYIAGTTLQSALDVVRDLNSKGIYATLDVLGEAVKNKEEAEIAKSHAMEALNSIVEEKLMANISIKPTQMGLSIDKDFAYEQILDLVNRANEKSLIILSG